MGWGRWSALTLCGLLAGCDARPSANAPYLIDFSAAQPVKRSLHAGVNVYLEDAPEDIQQARMDAIDNLHSIEPEMRLHRLAWRRLPSIPKEVDSLVLELASFPKPRDGYAVIFTNGYLRKDRIVSTGGGVCNPTEATQFSERTFNYVGMHFVGLRVIVISLTDSTAADVRKHAVYVLAHEMGHTAEPDHAVGESIMNEYIDLDNPDQLQPLPPYLKQVLSRGEPSRPALSAADLKTSCSSDKADAVAARYLGQANKAFFASNFPGALQLYQYAVATTSNPQIRWEAQRSMAFVQSTLGRSVGTEQPYAPILAAQSSQGTVRTGRPR